VGKFRSGWTGCDFGFGGLENTVPDFQFLVTSWQAASSGFVPSHAVGWGGKEEQVSNFYVLTDVSFLG
jgi:hypothetical protein